METYKKSTWLNNDKSSFTGNVVAFDGLVSYDKKYERTTFLSISDCYGTVRLHPAEDDTDRSEFLNKLKTLRSDIDDFISHLEEEKMKRDSED